MKTFRGKVGIVTGAAAGIGRALAVRLADEGVQLDLWDVDAEGLAETSRLCRTQGSRVVERVVDLTKPEEWQTACDAVLRDWPAVDLLVNNAGICYYGPTHCMTDAQWDAIMEVNLLAPVGITRHLLPHLLERPDAHVLNMCSISGRVASGRISTYHTTKFGLVGFTEALRAEYGRQGLGVTALCPGPVSSNLYDNMMNGRGRNKPIPQPPKILTTTPEKIAERAVKAIRKNQRRPVVTLLGHFVVNADRFAPWLIDSLNLLGRRKRLRRKAELANAPKTDAITDDAGHAKAA